MVIYKATNKINNKCYIGQTVKSLRTRKLSHINLCKNNRINNFYNAVNKYGWNNFKWEVLCECNSKEELDEMEFHYIKQYDTYKNGYNMTLGGDKGTYGWIPTKETRKKMSISKQNYVPWNKGKHLSEETKKKISKSKKGMVSYTKLNEDDIREILDLYFKYKIKLKNVGQIQRNGVPMSYKRSLSTIIYKEYGVTPQCIERIIDGKSWKHVYQEYKI
jgi:group I intron endonuclease